jgi:hypothetical protein
MPSTSDRELRAQLKLAARSYRNAQAKHAARPSADRAAKLAACQAKLAALLAQARDEMTAAA